MTAFVEIVQLLLVLERIHRRKETVIFVSGQLLYLNQTPKRFNDKLFSRPHISEYFPLQHKKSPIDAHAGLRQLLNFGDEAIRTGLRDMIAEVRPHAKEGGDFVLPSCIVDMLCKIESVKPSA